MDMFTATPRRSNNPHVSDVLHQMPPTDSPRYQGQKMLWTFTTPNCSTSTSDSLMK